MKVKELIKEFKKQDPEAKVVLVASCIHTVLDISFYQRRAVGRKNGLLKGGTFKARPWQHNLKTFLVREFLESFKYLNNKTQ